MLATYGPTEKVRASEIRKGDVLVDILVSRRGRLNYRESLMTVVEVLPSFYGTVTLISAGPVRSWTRLDMDATVKRIAFPS